jgi:hypothetical protein
MSVIVDSSKKEVHVYNCNFTNNEDWKKYEEVMLKHKGYQLYLYYPGTEKLKYSQYI